MNNKIRELAYQAGYGERWNTTAQFEEFLGLFSNLFLEEVIVIIDNHYHGVNLETSQVLETLIDVLDQAFYED